MNVNLAAPERRRSHTPKQISKKEERKKKKTTTHEVVGGSGVAYRERKEEKPCQESDIYIKYT